jgi:hypothetical protein
VRELSRGDTFSVGDTEANVIGPVGTYTIDGSAGNTEGVKQNHYVNNYSLTVMFTGGGHTFLSGGDIEAPEQRNLLAAYGKAVLDADIYKMPHHGAQNAFSEEFIDAVSPAYSFVHNGAFSGFVYDEGDGFYHDRKVHRQRLACSKHGFVYLVGDEKKDLLIHADQSGVKLYHGGKGGKLMSGWVTVKGGIGYYWQTDKYYFDPVTLQPATGYLTLQGKHYYMGTGGCMERAYYDFEGSYEYWREYDGEFRYYSKTGEFYKGIKTLGSSTYLFTQYGYRQTGLKEYGGRLYLLKESGAMYKNRSFTLRGFPVRATASGHITLTKPAGISDTGAEVLKGGSAKFVFNKSKKVSGYQVQYALDKKFKKGVQVTPVYRPGQKGKTSVRLQGLVKGKTYYIRVRAFRDYPLEYRTYGSWSKAERVKAA